MPGQVSDAECCARQRDCKHWSGSESGELGGIWRKRKRRMSRREKICKKEKESEKGWI